MSSEVPESEGSDNLWQVSGQDVFFQALAVDNTLPIERRAVRLWLIDMNNPLRWSVMPLLRLVYGVTLHLTWGFKRLLPFQFSAHRLLQGLICWFCKYFVSPEANELILRHYFVESSILNFLIDNSPRSSTSTSKVAPVELYPTTIESMKAASFVDHDQELFRSMRDLGSWDDAGMPIEKSQLVWDHFRRVELPRAPLKKWTQVLDFETSHVLFMCLFCLLLTRSEYRAAINGFNFDQSIALRISKMIDDPALAEMAYNKYPLYLVGPWNLTQRFLMHGFFTEYLYARLDQLRATTAK